LKNGGLIDGSLFVNGNAKIDSTTPPAITGDVSAGGKVSADGDVVGGDIHQKLKPEPVADQCEPAELQRNSIRMEEIDRLRGDAAVVIEQDVTYSNQSLALSGVVYVMGDLTIDGDLELTDDVLFIVDGNLTLRGGGLIASDPRGAQAVFLVPEGGVNVEHKGSQIDGAIQLGAVNESGDLKGSDLELSASSNLTVRGSIAVLDGDIDLKSRLLIEHTKIDLPDLKKARPKNWREIRF
jgi:hypothetical protein